MKTRLPILPVGFAFFLFAASSFGVAGDKIIDDFADSTFTLTVTAGGSTTDSSGPIAGVLGPDFEGADTRRIDISLDGGSTGNTDLKVNFGGSNALQVFADPDHQVTVTVTHDFYPGSNTSFALTEEFFAIGVLIPTQAKSTNFALVEVAFDDVADSTENFQAGNTMDVTTLFNSEASIAGEGNSFVVGVPATLFSTVNFNTIERIRWRFQTTTGSGRNFDIDLFANATPGMVPEPSTYAMFLSGIIGMALYNRRRRAATT